MSVITTATMISSTEELNAPLLRTEFSLQTDRGQVVQAELHASAQGIFEAFLGGAPVGDDVLSPGWSSYEWRLRYREYDVTDRVRVAPDGSVVLGLALGNGWFRGRLGWGGGRAYYGPELGGVAQLEIVFADGHRQVVGTDKT